MEREQATTEVPGPRNEEIADALDSVGELLRVQGANAFRWRAYERAAVTVRSCLRPLRDILATEGSAGLEALPGIGKSIAATIREHLLTGRIGLLERLEGEVAAEDVLQTIPGIGPELARRLHEDLAIDTLEELELAAHDGRLHRLAGFGPRRVRALRDQLATVLGRASRGRGQALFVADDPLPEAEKPPVETLLDVDEEYRRSAAERRLHLITPRRFNPGKRAWLPVLHVERDGWRFTALFSNTARAHHLGKAHDWVVIYAERNGREDRSTVVTEWYGPLQGERVVRGREAECARRYGRDELFDSSETKRPDAEKGGP